MPTILFVSEMTTFLCSTACLNDTIARSAFDASLFVHRMDLSKVLIHFMHNLDIKQVVNFLLRAAAFVVLIECIAFVMQSIHAV